MYYRWSIPTQTFSIESTTPLTRHSNKSCSRVYYCGLVLLLHKIRIHSVFSLFGIVRYCKHAASDTPSQSASSVELSDMKKYCWPKPGGARHAKVLLAQTGRCNLNISNSLIFIRKRCINPNFIIRAIPCYTDIKHPHNITELDEIITPY